MTSRRFAAVTFVLYAAITLWVTLHHEPWCDEADSWLLMRDGGVSTMLARTGYAGTPALWYLLLAPLASSGLPYLAQQLLNLALMWGAAYLFLFRSPFSPLVKVLFVFSYYMSYEYAIMARPYALMVLLLFAIAAMWKNDVAVAILAALLANTTSHGLIIAGVIAVLRLVGDRRPRLSSEGTGQARRLSPTIIALAGLVLAAMQLRVPADGPHVIRHIDPQAIPYAIGSAFFPGWDLTFAFAFGMVVLIAVLAALEWRMLFFFSLCVAALLGLFVFVWMGGLRHAGLLLILATFALWLSAKPKLVANACLSIALACSVIIAVETWLMDLRMPYSGGKEMGDYIVSHHLDREEIAVHPPNEAKSVFAFVPHKRFWFPASGRSGTYSMWDRRMDAEQATPLETAVARNRKRLLVTNGPIPPRFPCRLEYVTAEPLRGPERFYLYRCTY